MAKKRKSESPRLDEMDRNMYATFCTAANSISQLYTQAQQQEKIAFQAGERHCAEKLYHWLLRSQQPGSKISVDELSNYLQNELNASSGDGVYLSISPQLHQSSAVASQQQHHTLLSGFRC